MRKPATSGRMTMRAVYRSATCRSFPTGGTRQGAHIASGDEQRQARRQGGAHVMTACGWWSGRCVGLPVASAPGAHPTHPSARERLVGEEGLADCCKPTAAAMPLTTRPGPAAFQAKHSKGPRQTPAFLIVRMWAAVCSDRSVWDVRRDITTPTGTRTAGGQMTGQVPAMAWRSLLR